MDDEFAMGDDELGDGIRGVINEGPISYKRLMELAPMLYVLGTRDKISLSDELREYYEGGPHYKPWGQTVLEIAIKASNRAADAKARADVAKAYAAEGVLGSSLAYAYAVEAADAAEADKEKASEEARRTALWGSSSAYAEAKDSAHAAEVAYAAAKLAKAEAGASLGEDAEAYAKAYAELKVQAAAVDAAKLGAEAVEEAYAYAVAKTEGE